MLKKQAKAKKRGADREKAKESRDEVAAQEREEGTGRRERFLVLFRHGVAEPRSDSKPDEERSLTKEGHARMKEVARGLAEVFPRADVIYSSPLLRCVQTSLWLSRGYKGKLKPQTSDLLGPGGKPADVRKFLKSISERRVILVGHEPNLSANLRELLGMGGDGSLELKKGGCYGVRLADDGSATLEWVLTPRVLRRLAG